MVNDGLMNEKDTKLKIAVRGKNRQIKVNGKVIPENLRPKYERLLNQHFDIDWDDMDDNFNWNLNWEDDDNKPSDDDDE
jgi:hypothetical protein